MKLPELLSPAGGMEQLKAAVENGADAVYMGGRLFNARQNAENFGDGELKQAIEYSHVRGVNIYITMNTLTADAEMQAAVDAAGAAYEAGADALIVQDLGFAQALGRHLPDLPLHISTQGTIYSVEGILALAPLGFHRAILARELSLNEIGHIAQHSPIPVEVFAHGALCVCYSGQCRMSSMIGCRSGNRGKCAQPCRLPYSLGAAKGYLLSPKDLCALELLPELVDTGVAALKIEGRMKSPEYVAVVTGLYRKYLDKCADGGAYAVDETDMGDLLQIFNRGGFTTGYLKGRRGRELISREKPKNWGVPAGCVLSYNKAAKMLEVQLTGRLALGDGVEVANESMPGNIVTYLAIDNRKADTAGSGRAVLGTIDGVVRPGDELYKTSDKALNERARASYEGKPHRKVEIHAGFTAHAGEKLRFEVWDGDGHRALAESGLPAERAQTLPLTADMARAQLSKTGDFPFTLTDCSMDIDGTAAVRLSGLNALRRSALDALERARAQRYAGRMANHEPLQWAVRKPEPAQTGISLFLYRWRDDLSSLLHLADRVYAPFAAFAQGIVQPVCRPRELMAWLPPVSSGSLDALLQKHAEDLKSLGLDGMIAGNVEHIELLKGCGLPLYGDASLNAFNSRTLAVYAALGLSGITLSEELTMEQIVRLQCSGIETEAAVYGRLPLMASAHCPVGAEVAGASGVKPCGLCAGDKAYTLTDRTGARFPVLCDAADCRSMILNADILAVPGLAGRLAEAGVSMLRLYIHDEPPDEAERILSLFRHALQGDEAVELKGSGYTKGHYFREV